MLTLTLLLACVAQAELDALEAQISIRDAKLAELEAQLEARNARISEMQVRLAASIEASGPAQLGLPVTKTDLETGEVYPVLDERAVQGCAHQTLSSIKTAEFGYDAAFDEFTQDFNSLGWEFGKNAGCHRYLAVRVEVVGDDLGGDFIGTALVTHGSSRGKRFEITKREAAREVESLGEPAIEEWLTRPGWLGSAR